MSNVKTTSAGHAEKALVSKNIVLCEDGKYRWVYELNLFKDFSVLGILWKIFGGIILVGALIFFTVELFGSHDYMGVLKIVGIMAGIFLVLTVLGYYLYAAIMGGKYCIVFTMDNKGVLHEQQAHQAKKADLLAEIGVLTGAITGNMTTLGIGLSSGRRTALHTTFLDTKKLSAYPRKALIKLDSPLDHNRVYCEPEDFDFVWNYIKERCVGAKVVRK